MREAAPTHSPHSPHRRDAADHQNRSMEAWLCDPRPCASLSRLSASAERSRVHRCARRTSSQR
eukprot:1715528-Prymnesium_polylepis.1